MALTILLIITILSFSPLAPSLNDFLRKYMKIWEKILVIIAFASIIFLFPWLINMREIWEKALSVLTIILFLPILSRVFSVSIASSLIPYRRWLWILMGMLAFVHSLHYLTAPILDETAFIPFLWEREFWITGTLPSYFGIWFIALLVTLPMLLTSNVYSMKILGKKWKVLQRGSYLILVLVYLHVILVRENISFLDTITVVLFIIGKILEWKGVVLVKR